MRFGRKGRHSSDSSRARPSVPAEKGSEFDVIVSDDAEHFIPADEQGHAPASTCPCEPLRAQNIPGWYHRTLHPA